MTLKPKPGRPAISTPGARHDVPRRSPVGVLVSVVVHGVVILLLARLVIVPGYDWRSLLGKPPEPEAVERIRYLGLPTDRIPRVDPSPPGGDNRPTRNRPAEAPRLIAPLTVPTAIAEPPRAAQRPVEGGSGPLVGSREPAQGVRPSFSDPRVWAPPAHEVPAQVSPRQRLDSAIASMVQSFDDSLAKIPRERAPGDWTYTRNGKKYGIDGRMIHLGNFSLPTAILALLPLNATANPSGVERDRRLSVIRGEIREQAARAARDDDFHAAVKALRARKEKERQEQRKAAAEQAPPVVKP